MESKKTLHQILTGRSILTKERKLLGTIKADIHPGIGFLDEY